MFTYSSRVRFLQIGYQDDGDCLTENGDQAATVYNVSELRQCEGEGDKAFTQVGVSRPPPVRFNSHDSSNPNPLLICSKRLTGLTDSLCNRLERDLLLVHWKRPDLVIQGLMDCASRANGQEMVSEYLLSA